MKKGGRKRSWSTITSTQAYTLCSVLCCTAQNALHTQGMAFTVEPVAEGRQGVATHSPSRAIPHFQGLSREAFGSFQPRLLVVEALFRQMPPFVGHRLLTQALRMAGVRVGRATIFWALPRLIGSGNYCSRLSIGSYCGLNQGAFFDLEDEIRIGHHVAVGHDVMFLTRTHERGPGERRAGEVKRAPIVVEDGAWLGARVTVMPGVTIGAGAVIGASVVVNKDVPANTLVMGSTQVSLAKWR